MAEAFFLECKNGIGYNFDYVTLGLCGISLL